MGGRNMPIMPIMLSVVATFLSGILLLGAPADIYQKGPYMLLWFNSGTVQFLVTGWCVVPVLFKLRLTSIYEYLELRFDSKLLR